LAVETLNIGPAKPGMKEKTMTIQITETAKSSSGSYLQATCNKTSAMVCVHNHGLQVICQNACHKVWRGAGRFFPTAAAAFAGYKSAEMKAIIQAALDFDQACVKS